jgi:hypothetical protein
MRDGMRQQSQNKRGYNVNRLSPTLLYSLSFHNRFRDWYSVQPTLGEILMSCESEVHKVFQ